MNYNKLWEELIETQINKEVIRYVRQCIKEMFQKHGVEYTEQRIKEIYEHAPKMKEIYLKQYRVILEFEL